MNSIVNTLLIWSEVWALIIPLCFVFPLKKPFLRPVFYYLVIAFILNAVANIISNQKTIGINLPWHSNTILYNIHSIARFVCFSYFFIRLRQNHYRSIKRIIPFIYILLVFLNFTLFDSLFNSNHISGNLLTAESYLLLIYCLLYYLSKLKDEVPLSSGPDFWIVIGLSIYVVINFFVFLFYVPMIKENPVLANNIWSIHNVGYILLCLFIAKGFYSQKDEPGLNNPPVR